MRACFIAVVLAALIISGIFPVSATTLNFYTTQASFESAATVSLLDDFSFSGGTPVGPISQIGGHGISSLNRNGVTYTDVSGTDDIVILSPGDYWNFGAAVGTTTDYVVTTDYDEHIRADFSTNYSAFGVTAYFNGLGPGSLTVFGPGNSILGVLDFPPSGVDPATGLTDRGYLGVTSTDPITGFQWDTNGGNTINTGFSNLSVASAVPGPLAGAGGPGFIIAYGLFVWWRRMRRAYVTPM